MSIPVYRRRMMQPKYFYWNHIFGWLLILLLLNEFIVHTWQQIQSEQSPLNNQEEIQFNYRQGDVHHIVKRKLKLGRGFGGGKKVKSKPSSSNPYPKQPAYNPHYGASAPSYPKQPAYNPHYTGGSMGSAGAGYPKQPSHNPAYPSHSYSGNPAGPPPAYPGLGNNKPAYPQQTHIPHYPAPSNNYPGYKPNTYGGSMNHGNMFGQQRNTQFGNYGGNMYGGKKHKGLNIGRSIGSAGFGALAGTALGAYGGYKLGRMVGGLGRMGHYGYYSDHGRYVRCEPPRNIKVDPETNVSYIPLDEDYDRRCSYFDREPPSYIEPSMLRSSATIITNTINLPMMAIIIILSYLLQLFWINNSSRRVVY